MNTVVTETGRVLVINNIPNTEPQAFTVAIKNPADWQEMHDYIINENEIDGIPNRRIDCTAEMPFSTKRAVYQISTEEAEVLRQHPKVEWVEQSSVYNPICLEQRKYDEEFDRHTDTFRFKYDVNNLRDGGNPGTAMTFTQWGLHRHSYAIDPFGSEINETQDIKYQLTGKNVDVVIMDTGIRWDHPEFLMPGYSSVPVGVSTITVSRVRDILLHGPDEYGFTWADEGLTPPGSFPYTNYSEGNVLGSRIATNRYHGSHVGGTAAGNQFGAAFEANIWTIACIDRSDVGWAEPSDGFDYIRVWHKNKPVNPETGRKNPTIVNCSWGHRQFIRDDLSSSATFRGTTYTDGGNEYLNQAYNSIYYLDRLVYLGVSYFEFTTRRTSGQTTMDELLDDPDCQDVIFICSAGNSVAKQDTVGGVDYDNEFLTGTFYYNTSAYDSYWCRGGTPAIGHEGKPDAVISVASLAESYSGHPKEIVSSFSNRGPRTDVYGAGSNILSVDYFGYPDGRDTSFNNNYMNGTSMAAPNVTGVVALYLEANPGANRIDVRNWLLEHGTATADMNGTEGAMADDTTDTYWGFSQSLKGSKPRVLYNPFASNDVPSTEGVTIEGINFSYE